MTISLLLILSWLQVTVDCHGGPESNVTYEVSRMVGTCANVDTDFPACWVDLLTLPVDGLSANLADLPEPVVGEVQWLDVRAVDWSGNRSDAPCL